MRSRNCLTLGKMPFKQGRFYTRNFLFTQNFLRSSSLSQRVLSAQRYFSTSEDGDNTEENLKKIAEECRKMLSEETRKNLGEISEERALCMDILQNIINKEQGIMNAINIFKGNVKLSLQRESEQMTYSAIEKLNENETKISKNFGDKKTEILGDLENTKKSILASISTQGTLSSNEVIEKKKIVLYAIEEKNQNIKDDLEKSGKGYLEEFSQKNKENGRISEEISEAAKEAKKNNSEATEKAMSFLKEIEEQKKIFSKDIFIKSLLSASVLALGISLVVYLADKNTAEKISPEALFQVLIALDNLEERQLNEENIQKIAQELNDLLGGWVATFVEFALSAKALPLLLMKSSKIKENGMLAFGALALLHSDYPVAIESFNKVLHDNSGRALPYLGQAYAYLMLSEFEKAKKCLDAAEENCNNENNNFALWCKYMRACVSSLHADQGPEKLCPDLLKLVAEILELPQNLVIDSTSETSILSAIERTAMLHPSLNVKFSNFETDMINFEEGREFSNPKKDERNSLISLSVLLQVLRLLKMVEEKKELPDEKSIEIYNSAINKTKAFLEKKAELNDFCSLSGYFKSLVEELRAVAAPDVSSNMKPEAEDKKVDKSLSFSVESSQIDQKINLSNLTTDYECGLLIQKFQRKIQKERDVFFVSSFPEKDNLDGFSPSSEIFYIRYADKLFIANRKEKILNQIEISKVKLNEFDNLLENASVKLNDFKRLDFMALDKIQSIIGKKPTGFKTKTNKKEARLAQWEKIKVKNSSNKRNEHVIQEGYYHKGRRHLVIVFHDTRNAISLRKTFEFPEYLLSDFKKILEEAEERNKDNSPLLVTFTGFAFGAPSAEVALHEAIGKAEWEELYTKLQFDAVTFNSTGAAEFIKQLTQNKVGDNHAKATSTGYVSAPDNVNTRNKHLGNVIQIVPPSRYARGWWDRMWDFLPNFSRQEKSFTIEEIINNFDEETGQVKRSQAGYPAVVKKWPIGESQLKHYIQAEKKNFEDLTLNEKRKLDAYYETVPLDKLKRTVPVENIDPSIKEYLYAYVHTNGKTDRSADKQILQFSITPQTLYIATDILPTHFMRYVKTRLGDATVRDNLKQVLEQTSFKKDRKILAERYRFFSVQAAGARDYDVKKQVITTDSKLLFKQAFSRNSG